jgi:putative mRNA 3-end processing factor
VLIETPSGLFCPGGDFFIDPWAPVARAVITHAHGDHARPDHGSYLCATSCAPLLRRRFGEAARIETTEYGERIRIGTTDLSLHPAGHVRGSAQIRISGPEGVWVVGGDYKRAADPTCTAFEPVACDVFISESTFGLPIYRWDTTASVIDDIMDWWRSCGEAGRTAVLFCYTIGKAQRLLAELSTRTDRHVLVHGMMMGMIDVYREAGVPMLPVRVLTERPRGTSFAGELVLAPLSARGTPWMRRLGEISDGFASGLMRVRGVRRQRAFDRGFVLSDHADWPALLQTVAETGAARVLTTHGHAAPLARHLREGGLDSGTIRTAWEAEEEGE